jgi:uncharacterized protein (TIGR00369 family)
VIPDGFEPFSFSPFAAHVGSFYSCQDGALPVMAVLVDERHLNTLGCVHGGVLMTLADIALARAAKAFLRPGSSLVTAGLHIAFLGGARPGDWIEARPAVDRAGRSLVHASCVLATGTEQVAKASATFAIKRGRTAG